jgi:hypothetical protein
MIVALKHEDVSLTNIFINSFCTNILAPKKYKPKSKYKKAARTPFVQKSRTNRVGEVDYRWRLKNDNHKLF